MLFYLYVISIVVLHVIPTGDYGLDTTEFGPFRLDYLLHSVLFFPWMFLCLSRKGSGAERGFRRGLACMFVGIFVAIASETVQYWIPHRSFNPMDALFNALGVVSGALAAGIKPVSRRLIDAPDKMYDPGEKS